LGSELTTSQINALGERLRKAEPVAADLERLDSYRRSFDDAYRAVVRTLRDLALEPSGRIKTTISIVEKLKRQSFRLSKLQDIAGCRIVVDDIREQDRIVGLICGAFTNAKAIDRRQKPSHSYRAVHIVVEVTWKVCRDTSTYRTPAFVGSLVGSFGRQIRPGT
jgi:putative GTP pyrophosphokinase